MIPCSLALSWLQTLLTSHRKWCLHCAPWLTNPWGTNLLHGMWACAQKHFANHATMLPTLQLHTSIPWQITPVGHGCAEDEGIIFFFFCLFRATPMAYGGCQARGWIGAVADGLHHSQILNPVSKARDQICILMDASQIRFHWATTGTPKGTSLLVCEVIPYFSVPPCPQVGVGGKHSLSVLLPTPSSLFTFSPLSSDPLVHLLPQLPIPHLAPSEKWI